MADTKSSTKWRLNRRAVATIAILGLVLGLVVVGLQVTQSSRLESEAANQINQLVDESKEALAAGDAGRASRLVNRALQHLDRYLEHFPDDQEMLFLQARLMADRATGSGPLGERVARMHQRLLARFPDHEEADEVRVRLADLYIQMSDQIRIDYGRLGLTEQGVGQLRYDAAMSLIQQLDPEEPRTQALLGKTQEGQGNYPEAVAAYEKALERYLEDLPPEIDDEDENAKGVTEVAWNLARLHRDRQNDPEAAEEVLNRFASARPNSVDALLTRFFFFQEARDSRATQALEEALRRFPDDPAVLVTAVERALEFGDTITARARFEAIPEDYRRDQPRRIAMLGGLIDHYEQQNEQALDQWREGLKLVGGTDADLTWWLAYVSINAGKFDEVDRLIEQFERLSGDDDPRHQFLQALIAKARGQIPTAVTILEDLHNRAGVGDLVRTRTIQTLASCYEALGRREEADQLYQEVGPTDSGASIAVALGHAGVLEGLNRTQEAIQLLTEALDAHGDDEAALLLPLARLRLNEQARRPPANRSWTAFEQTVERAQRALPEQAIQHVTLELLLADRDLLSNQPDRADERLQAALDRRPTTPRLWAARAELLRQTDRPEEAIELLERGIEQLSASGTTLRLTLARMLVDLGRGREAQRRLIEGTEGAEASSQGELWQAVGTLRIAQGDYEGAREAFAHWREGARQAPDPILAMIELNLLANQHREAASNLELLKEISGEQSLPYRIAHASILLHRAERGHPELLNSCVAIMDGVLSEAPGLTSAHMLNGRIREAIGDRQAAADAYREAWTRGNREALFRLADLLVKLNQVDELEQLMTESGARATAGSGLVSAQALLAAGAGERAADRLLNAAVDDPNAPAVANALRARALLLAGRLDELETLLNREADRADPRNSGPWFELITIQTRLGRDQETLDRTIDRALDRIPDSVMPSELLETRLRLATGDIQSADKVIEEALDDEIASPDLMIGAASYYQQTGRSDRAEPILDRLMANPNVASAAALQLAMVLAERAAGDPDAWERALQLVSNGPMNPDRRLALAVVQSRAPGVDQRREAIPIFEALMADLPVMHPRGIEARNQLAGLLINLDQADRAAQITEISASQPAASAEAITQHVRALLKAGRLAEANSELSRLDLLRPGDPAVADLRSDLLLRANSGNPSDLKQAVEDRLGSPGGDLFARAACLQLLAVGTPEALEAADQLAQDLARRSPGYHWISGLVLASRGQSAEALERCSSSLEAVDLTDQTNRIGLTEAVLLAVQAAPIADRNEAAERAQPILEAMLKQRPGDPDLLTAQAILCHQSGDYQKEAELYREVLERRPSDLLALYNLALVLSEGLDQAEEALTQLDLLTSRIGSVPMVLGARGVILTRLERFDEAIEDLERAIEIEPSAARHYYLARAYHKAGREEQFRTHLDQAQRDGLDPDSIDQWHQDELQELLAR